MREIAVIRHSMENRTRGCARGQPGEPNSATICLLNWSAPSMVTSGGMETQSDVASCLLHESSQNIGLLLSPMFAYKKGGVWTAEKQAMNMLADKALLLERSWSLLFAEQRDKRPTLCHTRGASLSRRMPPRRYPGGEHSRSSAALPSQRNKSRPGK